MGPPSTSGSSALGAVLAGGLSTLAGEPKATAKLAGRPLVSYPLAALAEAGIEPAVVVKPDSQLPPLDCRVIHEPAEPVHPLAGLVAALEAADGHPVVALACDTPFVPADLLAWLAGLPDSIAVAFAAGRVHPLLGRYSADIAGLFAPALDEPMPLTEAVVSLDPRLIGEPELARFGDPKRIVFNVNSQAELQRAEELFRA